MVQIGCLIVFVFSALWSFVHVYNHMISKICDVEEEPDAVDTEMILSETYLHADKPTYDQLQSDMVVLDLLAFSMSMWVSCFPAFSNKHDKRRTGYAKLL